MGFKQSETRIRWLLFLFLTSLFLLTTVGYVTTSMGVTALLTAQNMMLEGRISLDQPTLETGVGLDGKYYTYEGLAFILVVTVFAFLARYLGFYPYGIYFTNQILTPVACVLLYQIGRELNFSKKTSLILALVYGVGTMAWVHSRFLMPEPLTTVVFLGAFLSLIKFKNKGHRKWLLICGSLTGLALLVRPEAPLFMFCIMTGVLWLLYNQYKNGYHSAGTGIVKGCLFMVPILLFSIVYLYYNHMRFGELFELGYSTKAQEVDFDEDDRDWEKPHFLIWRLTAFAGMWIVPCRSIFFINPVLIFAFWGIKDFFRKLRFEFIIITMIIVSHSLLYANRGALGFSGSSAWGVRYMVPMTAFMVLLMGPFIGRILKHVRYTRLVRIFGVVLLISVLFQLIGTFSSYHLTQNHLTEIYNTPGNDWAARKQMNFNPRWNLILMNLHWVFVEEYALDYMYYAYYHPNEIHLDKYRWQNGIPGWVEWSFFVLGIVFLSSGYFLIRRVFPLYDDQMRGKAKSRKR